MNVSSLLYRFLIQLGTPLALSGVLFLSGCTALQKTSSFNSSSMQNEQGTAVQSQAQAAWKAGNFLEAERLYTLLGKDGGLAPEIRANAWEHVAKAALTNKRGQSAVQALEQWRLLQPAVATSPAWKSLQADAARASGSSVPLYSGCVALALPTSGVYAPFGAQVAEGAKAAQAELKKSGVSMEVKVVDTEAPDWLTQLAQLPPECVAVGGPLRPDAYAAAKQQSLTRSRAFFTFLSQLEGNDEGTVAWRFFSSPSDQVNAMLRFAGELGIKNFGVLSPGDVYAQKMTELFVHAAEASGSTVQIASYQSGDIPGLTQTMTQFVGGGATPNPPFQAVFIPDSWQNVTQVVPYLFYQGEDRLVLMGTTLWEQGLSNAGSINVANMDLAVFPGAWNGATPNEAASVLITALAASGKPTPNFWVSFGYDFVRFASALHLNTPGWTARDINNRLSTAQNIHWSMAPITWNRGRASQHLFIFHPISTGFEPVITSSFQERLENIRARHARRGGTQ